MHRLTFDVWAYIYTLYNNNENFQGQSNWRAIDFILLTEIGAGIASGDQGKDQSIGDAPNAASPLKVPSMGLNFLSMRASLFLLPSSDSRVPEVPLTALERG